MSAQFLDTKKIHALRREYARTNPYGFPELHRRQRIVAKNAAPVLVYSSRHI